MPFLDDLRWRNLVHQTTDDAGLSDWLDAQPRVVYAGFDPTADSLHVGHLLPLLMLRRFQNAGHKPIAVVGGATGMIGDPSGKSQERNLLSAEGLARNVESIREQMRRFLDFDRGAELINNLDWIGNFSYLDFLRDVGKNFPVNVMLAKDSVKSRLGRDDAGISYTEFSYMLLQAYDFVHLHREFNCELQVGGSDQWGNITAGIDLARRMEGVQLYGLTNPLLTKSDGTKMGKTEHGALWLAPERTSPYQFFQYWINVDDIDAGNCLRMLTELSREEIEALDKSRAESPQERASQRRLAEELTRLVHGEAALQAAVNETNSLFNTGLTDQLKGFLDIPSTGLSRTKLENEGLSFVEILVEAGLAKSNSEARRLIEQGGAYINDIRIDDVIHRITKEDVINTDQGEWVMIVRSGKRKRKILRFK